jgi:alkylresorcinol/alkylpyrone synthase
MPSLKSISTISFPNKVEQQEVKRYAHDMFVKNFPAVERMMPIFDNTEIVTRNFCRPLDYYASLSNFKQQNAEYISTALEFSVQAIQDCLNACGIDKEKITDLVFISTSGLATPSLDALIINKMRLSPYVNRIPVFGLGCGGGVSGYAKAQTLAKANPDAVVLLVAVELCSLTFLRNDFSKSNFVATSLFSDGVAASLVLGDNHLPEKGKAVRFIDSQSKLYYDTLDVMGWEFQNEGFKVLFSHDIPTIIGQHIREDVNAFLQKNNLTLEQISNFIFHPGGKKVLTAYADALLVEGDFLKNTREVMNENGNMSSVTVLYVLEKFWKQGFKDGYGLMVAMGPGFSSEMVLLDMKNE